ncbi:MAG: DegV family protein [Nitriliruptoraceae bacterium]|nr:DegV family protein [Nitriliruptoraceae bacterium]
MVTDSTADLPVELVERLGLRVVPLSVAFGTRSFIAGVTLSPAGFYAELARDQPMPTTSQPAPLWFEEAYADCVDDGYDAIVSLHCSAALSGTVSLARDRAARAPIPVEVVDSRLVGGSLGLAALAAHRVASSGGTVAEVVAAAERVRTTSVSLLVVEDLAHLKRGGRLTGAQAAIGSAMRVKPVLHVTDEGRVEVRERARTMRRALDRVAAIAAETARGQPVDAIVVHAVAPSLAAEVWDRLGSAVRIVDRHEALIGPIVGAHVGPGAVGCAIVPREPDASRAG